LVYICFFSQESITVIHKKKEQGHAEETLKDTFSFTWELKMVFDKSLHLLEQAELAITSLNFVPDFSQAENIKSILKDWQLPTYVTTASIKPAISETAKTTTTTATSTTTTTATTGTPETETEKKVLDPLPPLYKQSYTRPELLLINEHVLAKAKEIISVTRQMKDMAEGKTTFNGTQAGGFIKDIIRAASLLVDIVRLVRRVNTQSTYIYKIQLVVSKDVRNLTAQLTRFLTTTLRLINNKEKLTTFDKSYAQCVGSASSLKTSVMRLKWEDAALWHFTVKKA